MNLSATIKRLLLLGGILFLLFMSMASKGANITWNNSTGNNNWNTPGNWNTGVVPGPADVAIFNGTSLSNCTLNTNINVRGVSITAAYLGSIIQQGTNTINIGISNYAQAGGNFVGDSGDITLDSTASFNLTGGNFTSTSGNFIITGNRAANQTIVNYTAGLFNHNNGTFIINPILSGCVQRTFTINVITTTNFYDVIIDGQSLCGIQPLITTSAGDIINATNNLTHKDGSISGKFAVKNNLFIDGTADEGTGSITVDGIGIQTYAVSPGIQRTCALIVNKTSGVFEPEIGTTDLPVTLFTLQNGDFFAPSGNLDIGGNWTSNQTLFNHSSGNFFHNNGTLLIHPNQNSCVLRAFTINVNPATAFYNVNVLATTVCAINPTIVTLAGDTINATNDLILTDGSITGKFAVKNNLIITGTADAGTGLITFNGTGIQTYAFEPGSQRTSSILINKDSGIVEPAAGTTDLLVNLFTLQSGDFVAPSGNLDFGGSFAANAVLFNQTGGNYIHNSGTLLVNPVQSGCTQRSFTLNVMPGTIFNDVNIVPSDTCPSSSIIITPAGDTIIAEHNLVHENGVLNGTFAVRNNLYIKSNSDGGTGNIIFNGTGAQEYSMEVGATRTCNIIVDKSAGILIPATGTVDFFPRLFTLKSGDFTAPPGNLDLGSTWAANTTIFTQTGGNYIHNNGTLLINPVQTGCTQRTFTLDILPTSNFYDVVINPINGCPIGSIITTLAGDTLNAENNLTHFDGVISGKFSVKNNLYIKAGSDGGIGSIIVNGAADQYYFVDSFAPRTCGVIINKSSGNIIPDTTTSDFYVQYFSLISGNFVAPLGVLNIGGPWAANASLYSQAGGNFTHNNGSVSINPVQSTCTQRTFTLDVIPSTEFYNLEINGATACAVYPIITTAVGDVVNASHDLVHTDGIINGKFAVKNNLIISATADGGIGSITADGVGNQTYEVDSISPRTCGIIVNKPSGTFSPVSGTNNFFVKYFSLQAGEFNAPAGKLNTGGPWAANATLFSHTAGIYNHNNGTLTINPLMSTCTQRTFTLDVIPTTELFNVEINATTACALFPIVTTAVGDVVNACNDLVYSDGIVNGKFAVKNDLYIAGAVDGGTGSITADGNGMQTYFVDSIAPRICGLIVNKASGNFSPAPTTKNFSVLYFALQNGDFTAPVDTFNTGGTWGVNQVLFNQTGGTYHHNNGTLSFNPALSGCIQRTFIIDVLPSTALYNFEIKGLANCSVNPLIATAPGDIINITHDFSHIDGTVTGQFSVKNDLRVASGADLATGTIYFEGTANQLYTFESGAQRTCNIIVNKTTGAVDPAFGTSNFLVQSTTFQEGDFTAPIGNFDIGGSWSVNQTLFNQVNGTFHHNSGTLVFNPILSGCTQRTFSIDVVPSTVFYNMVFNGIQSCGINPILTCVAGDSLYVKNQLKYQDGVCNAIVKEEGNTDVSPTFDGGSGTLIFQGANNQNFDLTGANAFFNAPIIINKTANDVSLLSPCILDQAGTQSLTLINGKLRTSSANLLTIGDNIPVNGASASSYIEGPCRKIGDDAFIFPVGKNSLFAPISISAPLLSTDEYIAEFFPTDPFPLYNVFLKDPTLNHLSRVEYWMLNRNNGTSNTTVTLSWSSPGSGGVNNPNDLLVGGWNGLMWKDRGNGGTTGNSTAGTIVTNGVVNQYGPFTLTSGTLWNPLPVELSSFKGSCENKNIELLWSTESETNNNYFGVEKSLDGIDWEEIGSVRGHGNSSTTNSYTFTSTISKPDYIYYRLKQYDFDGNTKFSEIIIVDNCSEFSDENISIYPNPSSGKIHLSMHINKPMQGVEIYNSHGVSVYKNNSDQSDLDLTYLNDGIYYIQLILQSNVIVKKFVIKK